MGLTKSERHNRMIEKTFDHYNKHQYSIPSVHLYNRLMELANEKLGITIEEASNKYGLYTVKQWEELLKLGWHKQ